MKKNLYYKEMFGRPNLIKKWFLGIFLSLSTFFRIPIEVLVRKKMGERYFSLFQSILFAIILLTAPYISGGFSFHGDMLLTNFGTWYLFTAFFVFNVYKRWQEVKHEPSVFDFAKFSLSTGEPHPFFMNIRFGKDFSPRLLETVIEPGAFFIAGVILAVFIQPIGFILIFCSIVYSLGYMAAYNIGDDFVMDMIDEMICNQDMEKHFMDDGQSEKGVKFYARKPNSTELRSQLLDRIIVEEDEDVVLAS